MFVVRVAVPADNRRVFGEDIVPKSISGGDGIRGAGGKWFPVSHIPHSFAVQLAVGLLIFMKVYGVNGKRGSMPGRKKL